MNVQSIRKKYPPNLPCPCGSSKQYKYCCVDSGVDFELNARGEVCTQLPMCEQMTAAPEQQWQTCIDTDVEQRIDDELTLMRSDYLNILSGCIESSYCDIMNALLEANIKPEVIYAYRKTGLLLTDSSLPMASEQSISEWNDAIDEYFRLKRSIE